MSVDVVVIASFMMDHIAYVDRRPVPGETVRGSDFLVVPGGKGFNQAVAAARAGANVQVLGRLGDDDLGRRFLERLSEEGIDAAGVDADDQAATGVGLPVVDRTGENAIVVVPGANDRLTAADMTRHAETLARGTVLMLQREVPVEAGARAARIAHEAGALVVLNPAPAGPIGAFRGVVDVVVPNEGELAALSDGDDMVARARRLSDDLGGCDVIVTLGADGVLIVGHDGVRSIEALRVESVDTTGAGDCFCGSLAARLAAGDGLDAAARYAVVAAGLAVQRRGGADSAPSRQDVIACLEGSVAPANQDGGADAVVSTMRTTKA